MSKFEIVNKLTRAAHTTGFKIKKHSPEILVVSGVVGVVTSAVMACKATTKIAPVLEEAKANIDNVHASVEAGECKTVVDGKTSVVPYSEEDGKKDLAIFYAKTGVELAKLYAPSVILGALSITAILSSSNILRKRNIALAAAYTAVDKSFKDYRGRVVERFGEALDKELRYNIKSKEVDVIEIDENGEAHTTKKVVDIIDEGFDPSNYSQYARFFDDGCLGWDKDSEYNLMFLKHQENTANELLRAKGHLFLNEVYDMLGIPRTKAGQIVGWVYNEKHPVGDNFVDFGIYNTHNKKARDFVNGYERVILLDFNVDGVIYDLLA